MTRSIPPSLAFDLAEYDERAGKLRAAMTDAGIDVLFVTSPANTCYLTGYVASWYAPRLPIGVVVHRSSPELIVVDWSRHVDYVPTVAIHDALILVDYGSAHDELAAALDARGWTQGTVAIEYGTPTPVTAVMTAVERSLREHGAEVVAGDHLVDDLRVLKSPAERAVIRRAGAILDDVFAELAGHLRPGITELEVAAIVTTLLAVRGSEVPAQHPLVSSGPSAWADVHAFPSRRELERGDVVSVDACAVIDRYHVNLSRAFVLGAPTPLAERCVEAGARGLAVMTAEARADEGPERALALAAAAVRAEIPPENVWWIGGYSLGIAFPPSWVGHVYLANDGPRRADLAPGYVSNFETVLFDAVEGFEVAGIDTVMMDDDGVLAPLSRIPRTLLRV